MYDLLLIMASVSLITSVVWSLILTEQTKKAHKLGFDKGEAYGRLSETLRIERLNADEKGAKDE